MYHLNIPLEERINKTISFDYFTCFFLDYLHHFSMMICAFLKHISLLGRLFSLMIFDIPAWRYMDPMANLNTLYRILSEKHFGPN